MKSPESQPVVIYGHLKSRAGVKAWLKGLMCACLLALLPAAVAIAAGSQVLDKAYYAQLNDGRLMVGRVSLALLALEDGQLDTAATNVAEALKLAQDLEKSAPTFASKNRLSFGRLTHEAESKTQILYIPLADRTFVVHGFDAKPGKSGEVRETDATMVHAHVTLDVRKAIGGLTDAKAALDRKDAKAADQSLTAILKATVTHEMVSKDPLQVVHDNLTLSRELLTEKRYTAARFALKYAKQGLVDYKTPETTRKQHVEQMEKDIEGLYEQLAKEDPTLLQRAIATIESWAGEIDGWLARDPTHSKPQLHKRIP